MKKNTRILAATAAIAVIAVAAFVVKQQISVNHNSSGTAISIIGGTDGPTSVFLAGKVSKEEQQMAEYTSISMDEAKEIFKTDGDYIILDVRRSDEFAGGHIPGAINVANEDIGATEPSELPDKDQVIYVYCRSGNRSKQAAAKLAALGYSSIIEIGGILDWTGDVEK